VKPFPNLSAARAVVLDTETTGVDWRRDRPVGYVVAWGPAPDEVGYWPTAHATGRQEPDKVRAWVRDLVARPDLKIVNHALKFDLHMADRDGIQVAGPLECTLVNMALIDEHRRSYGLDTVAETYEAPAKKTDIYQYLSSKFGLKADTEKDARKTIGMLHQLDAEDPRVHEYACGDGTATWHVWQKQQADLDADNLRTVWGVECRLIRVLYHMERRGVRIDQDQLARVKLAMQRMLEEARRSMPKDFNARSSKQVQAYLESDGVDGWPRTEKGAPSFTEAWLEESEAGKRIIAIRRIENLLASFIGPLENLHIINGRVHPDFNQLRQDDYGTISGRLSCSFPNLQQVPKRNVDLARLYRSIFLPEEGHEWGSADYNQAEFRIFADYTQSAALIEGYRQVPPRDIHMFVSEMISVPRYQAKRINLGLLYGMGKGKLARSTKTTVEQAAEWRRLHDLAIPEGRTFLRAAESAARARGWVRTKLHRRARFPDVRICHKAGSRVIQGTNADIIKLKNVECAEHLAGSESAVTLSIHDELTFSIAPGEHRRFLECVSIMSNFTKGQPIEFQVPMAVDAHTGRNWSEASFPEGKE